MAEVTFPTLAKQDKVFSHCSSIFRAIKSVCTCARPQRGVPPVLHDSGPQHVALPPALGAPLLPPLFSTQKQIFPFYCFCAFFNLPQGSFHYVWTAHLPGCSCSLWRHKLQLLLALWLQRCGSSERLIPKLTCTLSSVLNEHFCRMPHFPRTCVCVNVKILYFTLSGYLIDADSDL